MPDTDEVRSEPRELNPLRLGGFDTKNLNDARPVTTHFDHPLIPDDDTVQESFAEFCARTDADSRMELPDMDEVFPRSGPSSYEIETMMKRDVADVQELASSDE